ncbi:MAG: ABC-type amino acid transport substrate-binding protein [Flavobacterium sp.]|jgi:ABC-type amino acid transport substrate-binding protein
MAKFSYFSVGIDTFFRSTSRALAYCLLLPLLLLSQLFINAIYAQTNIVTTKQNKIIKIGINATVPPFTFVLPNGRPIGMFVDMWQTWADINNHSVVFLPMTHE